MRVELDHALRYLTSHLYTKMPRRRVDMLADELDRQLRIKFDGHWHPDEPVRGSGFRCVPLGCDRADDVLETSARLVGLNADEVRGYLPQGLVIWIDPGEVSYRLGEYGYIQILYSSRHEHVFNRNPSCAIVNDAVLEPDDMRPSRQSIVGTNTGTSDVTNGNSSPTELTQRRHPPSFTAATFAQTKFGSTKMKCDVASSKNARLPTSPRNSRVVSPVQMALPIPTSGWSMTPLQSHLAAPAPLSQVKQLSVSSLPFYLQHQHHLYHQIQLQRQIMLASSLSPTTAVEFQGSFKDGIPGSGRDNFVGTSGLTSTSGIGKNNLSVGGNLITSEWATFTDRSSCLLAAN